MKFKWLPVIDAEKCTGCNLCVEACGPKCLEIVEGIAALPRPDQCGSEEHCIGVCRDDAIHMQWVPFAGNESFGLWRSEASDLMPPGHNTSELHNLSPQLK